MIESGTLLQNRYRVIKQIGQGGMGAVYVATDERFQSTVAVKQTFFDDPNLRRAFEREAHLLNHLRHTTLPRVSDHFTEDGGQFLVMEFIEGSDISELLKQRGGALPLADVLAWADELLDALDYLHTQEPPVVHRDIKPQNLKLTSRGHIVLLDFGLAKGTSTPQARAQQNLTASVFGYSRNYAPLEQIQGTGTDARSDLYSLGATLYHLLTGTPPVDALTRASAIVNGLPDPLRPAHHVHAQVPTAVGEVLRRAMAQNAAHRQSTAADMRAALRRAASAKPDTLIPVSSVHAEGQTATDMPPTVLEPTRTAYGQGPLSETVSMTTRLSHPAAAGGGESTIVDARGAQRRRPATPFVQPFDAQPPTSERKSKAMLAAVALVVLVACALVAFPLMRRSGGEPPLNPQAQSDASTDASTAETPTAAPGTTQAESSVATSTAAPGAQTTPTPSSSPAAAGSESPAANSQPAMGNADGTTAASGPNSDASKGAPLTVGATADKSGLVIQAPVGASAPQGNRSAAAEYDAQRAEELKRRREQQNEELRRQREREQSPQYMAAPEHYELDRRGPPPPPPGGGGLRPPPPGRRP